MTSKAQGVDNSNNKKPRPLKERRFVQKYIENGGNGTQAVIDAGYNVKDRHVADVMAASLMERPAVRAAIDRALVALDLGPDYVLQGHKDLHEQAFQEMDGKKKLKSPAHGMVAERALENIGKIADYYPKEKASLDIDKNGISISWQSD